MPITFDTLDELKAFYQTFKLDEKLAKALPVIPARSEEEELLPSVTRRPRGVKTAPADKAAKESNKPGRKPRMQAGLRGKAEAVKPRRDRSNSLTARIQQAIQNFIDKKNSFTANDVYDVIAKKDPSINKQSVITSVLKQMNSTFEHISVTERAGRGPRPVKLYNA